MQQKYANRIKEVVDSAFSSLNEMIDVNTVMGTPVSNEFGDYIIPVAKVTFCILTGGGEYGKTTIFKKGEDLPFSAGNGAIVSIKPCGFLIKEANKDYKSVCVCENGMDNIFDKITDYMMNLSDKKGENV